MAYEAFDRLNQLVMELTDGYPRGCKMEPDLKL